MWGSFDTNCKKIVMTFEKDFRGDLLDVSNLYGNYIVNVIYQQEFQLCFVIRKAPFSPSDTSLLRILSLVVSHFD